MSGERRSEEAGKEETRIAILSDTHSLLRPETEEMLTGCDCILHAGDIASRETYDRIGGFAPAYFVRGNADGEWAEELPKDLDVTISGFHFYMVHNIKEARKDLSGVDFVVYGHSHRYENRRDGEITCLNPGSCGPRRFTQPVTMMIMTIGRKERNRQIETAGEREKIWRVEKIDLSPVLKRGAKHPPQKEMDKLIRSIVRDMNAGKPVEQIALRNHVEKELTEEILQIYTTHPGIDTDGILNRMS